MKNFQEVFFSRNMHQYFNDAGHKASGVKMFAPDFGRPGVAP